MVERAKQILAQLENQALDGDNRAKLSRPHQLRRKGDLQLTLFAPPEHPLMDELRALDLNGTAPLEAWRWLERWQQHLAQRNGKP